MSCWQVVRELKLVLVVHEKGAAPEGNRSRSVLAAQAESLDETAVARDVLGLQVLQEPSALPDEQQQATA